MNTAAFLTYTFLTAYTPGPNNIMAMTNASRDGFRQTMPFIRGMFFGFFFVMLGCALFSSALYRFIPSIQPAMLTLGAAYLLFLAWSVWRDKSQNNKSSILQKNSFICGATLQLVNVKIILYGITALSSYVLPHYKGIDTILLFSLLLTFIGISGCVCWALFGAALERLFKKRRKLLNGVMAMLLIYCAVSLFL